MEVFRTMESYRTNGTCAKQIIFKVTDNKLVDCRFIGGCSGNLQGLQKLIINRDINELIESFKDIKCRNNTSCPAQLAAALEEYKKKQELAAKNNG